MREPSGAGSRILALVLMILVAANILVLARSLDILRFPGEITDTEIIRGGAEALADYYERASAASGLAATPAVRDALAKFKFEVEQAVTSDEIAGAIATYGRAVQDVISREEENQRREIVLGAVRQDEAVRDVEGRVVVRVGRDEGGEIAVSSDRPVLSAGTIARLRSDPSLAKLASPVEVEISDGKASLVAPRTAEDALRVLQAEADSLRAALESVRRSAGLSQLEGPGIVVSLYDAPGGYSREDVVQEKDVRDMVNELFAAGALGVEVGGRRLTATSSIRSAGPLLLVNREPIPVNPVVIRAVGDPAVLESSLGLAINSLKPWGIRVDVERHDSVVLSAYAKEGS